MIAIEIPYQDPLLLFACIATDQWAMFLDSSDAPQGVTAQNRYSYFVMDPLLVVTYQRQQLSLQFPLAKVGSDLVQEAQRNSDPFDYLQALLTQYASLTDPAYPPFQGGLVGYLAYDLCHVLEAIPPPAIKTTAFADLVMGVYDSVVSFDHNTKQAWVLSHGLAINEGAPLQATWMSSHSLAEKKVTTVINRLTQAPKRLMAHCLQTIDQREIVADFSAIDYQQAVNKIKQAIQRGDLFEANMSQRLTAILPPLLTPFELYCRLRYLNPASFSAFLQLDKQAIASVSPERFLLLGSDSIVETRPIKGTRPRGRTLLEDHHLRVALCNSRKDHAENVMIVDLMRNDLSKVCENHSIVVSQCCQVESFPFVHHLVSVIRGKLKAHHQALDLLKATFPGGSITGAPKVSAMKLIAELEGKARGPYCGSIIYLGFDGSLQASILIRTCLLNGREITFQTGGAVVLGSDARSEYEEIQCKATAFYNALTQEMAWSY